MKITRNSLVVAFALFGRLIAAQAQPTYDPNFDSQNPVASTGPYDPADQYVDPQGFTLPGWAQMKDLEGE